MLSKEEVLTRLKRDSYLEVIMLEICQFTVIKKPIGDGYRWEVKSFLIRDILDYLHREKVTNKSIDVIKDYIQVLIDMKLVRFTEKESLSDDLQEPMDRDNTNDGALISIKTFEEKSAQVTVPNDGVLYSGLQFYKDNFEEIEADNYESRMNDVLKYSISRMQRPLEDKISQLSSEVDSLKKYVEKTTRDSLIKNIEIITLFTAVITILITNVFGFVGAQPIELKKIIALSFSIIFALVILLAFIQTMILERNLDRKTLVFIIIALIELAAIVVVFTVR